MTGAAPAAVMERIRDAVNSRDMDALMACYAPDIRAEEPTLMDRDFRGSAQLRANWNEVLAGLPELTMDLLACVVDGDTVWAEWRWSGRRADGTPIFRTGVIIYDVRGGRVVRLRRYMGPLQKFRVPFG
jgi:ketosteroid isomerase-like protein